MDDGLDDWLESCRRRLCPRYRLRCALVDIFRAGPGGFLSYPQAFEVGWNSHADEQHKRDYTECADKKSIDDTMFHIKMELLVYFANKPIRYNIARVRDLGWRLVRLAPAPPPAPPNPMMRRRDNR